MLALAMALTLAGCASLPAVNPVSRALTPLESEQTALGQRFAAAQAKAPGQSGVLVLERGNDAFDARITLADSAARTIDVQSFLWFDDVTGKLILSRLLSAAQHGVRVRVLIDDLELSDFDFSIALFNAHPNFEVRVFNPFTTRSNFSLFRVPEFLVDSERLDHRMHNKMFISDDAVAIVGGRNIGDHYFGVGTDANYRDLDVLVVGTAVKKISAVFDSYWNSPWAVPLKSLVDSPSGQERAAKARESLQNLSEQLKDYPYPHPYPNDRAAAEASLASIAQRLTWAPVSVFADDPAKVDEPNSRKIGAELGKILDSAHHELLIESAYFVPLNRGVAALKRIHDRGVHIRVLTNSLASTDVVLAYVGYAHYRRALLENGIELHEFRPDGRPFSSSHAHGFSYGSSRVNLHSKAIVIDRRWVFIGTPNLDPRSIRWNTEVGLLIDSPSIADTVARFIENGLEPRNSWWLTFDDASADSDIVWTSERNGVQSRYTHDPEAGLWRNLSARFLFWLPIDDQL